MLRFTSKLEQAVAEATEQAIAETTVKVREQAIAEGIEKGREEGIAKGRVEVYRAWADWNKRRGDAVAKGVPFNDPPPPNPENGTGT